MGGESVARTRPCKWCQVPVEQPRGRWRRRRYCNKRHRRWYRFWDSVKTVLDGL